MLLLLLQRKSNHSRLAATIVAVWFVAGLGERSVFAFSTGHHRFAAWRGGAAGTRPFSSSSPASSGNIQPTASTTRGSKKANNNILILDHLNINHERGRHDWLISFYFDFLQCIPDPRKAENLSRGRKTVWANIGAHQFHLPEGDPEAQVLQGRITLAYPDLAPLRKRAEQCQAALEGSQFRVKERHAVDENHASCGNIMEVTDPWGTSFLLVEGGERDSRGQQPGEGVSEGLGLQDLTIYCPSNSDMAGIGRFYETILGAPIVRQNQCECVVDVGPQQTLTFCHLPTTTSSHHGFQHDDLRDEEISEKAIGESDELPHFPSNYGPHVSIYVRSLPAAFAAANALGLVYVNPRFQRRAYTLEQAAEQCMFRILDVVDPDTGTRILRLEHEVHSVVKMDGSMYKSCPFDEIPEGCEALASPVSK